MPRVNHQAVHLHETEEVGRRCYSPEALPLFQALLATLADLDFDYERERDRISSSTPDPSLQTRALRKLEETHPARRDTYIRHLTVLQQRGMQRKGV